jgi:ankyrin repeat protein
VSVSDAAGLTALHHAVRSSCVENVKVLLSLGAQVNATDLHYSTYSRTPTHAINLLTNYSRTTHELLTNYSRTTHSNAINLRR